MPTYIYRFIDSNETVEVYQAFADDALTEIAHPSDGVPRKVKKVFTPVGITFKGGGFYKTDSSTNGGKSAQKTETAAKPDTPSDVKTDTKTESKTETKSEVKSETKSVSSTTE